MIKATAKSHRMPPKTRELYTPEPVRGRVVALHMSGQSNRQIAKREGIDRETVSRILSKQEVTEMLAEYQSRLLIMVPKAIKVFEEALGSDDERVRMGAATKLLEGMRVLNTDAVGQAAAQEPDPEQRKIQFLGQMTKTILEKSRRYALTLPQELASLDEHR